MDRVAVPLNSMGAHIRGTGDKITAPIMIEPRMLKPIRYRLPMASAQVKSAILLAGLYAQGTTTVLEPVATRDHTEKFYKYAGIKIQKRAKAIRVQGHPDPKNFSIEIPGDISSAAFLMAMGVLLPDTRVTLNKVLWNKERNGIVDALKKMGARIRVQNEESILGPEETRTITLSTSKLKSIDISKSQIPSLIDELPILMVLATQAKGRSVFKGVEELRVKETDRVQSMVGQLKKMGANIKATHDTVVVQGPTRLRGASIQSFGDHRTAMSFIVAGMAAEGETRVRDLECIRTSFPSFFKILKKAGCRFNLTA
jgi:3-phosphoshikimate 1-carboxyvinyltransferase